MPSPDRIQQLFSGLAVQSLPVPPAAKVLARGRQRRRRARLTASVSAAAVVGISLTAIGYFGHPAGHVRKAPITRHHRRAAVPPGGQVVLGVVSPGHFELEVLETSSGSGTARPHLKAVRPVHAPAPSNGFQTPLASSPAGGWVVTYLTGTANKVGLAPSRLATVSRSGAVVPFGPVFSRQESVTGLAVNPAGSMVAVAVWRHIVHFDPSHPQRGLRPGLIQLVPLPGHSGSVRTWTLGSPTATQAESLSWQDSTHLTYIPGGDETGGGFAGSGAVTLNVAEPGGTAPASPTWPPPSKTPGSCWLVSAAWVRARYLALEYCAGGIGNVLVYANPVTGQQLSGRVKVHGFGCPSPQLNPAPDGRAVLVPSCQLQLYRPGRKIVQLGASLFDAAFAG